MASAGSENFLFIISNSGFNKRILVDDIYVLYAIGNNKVFIIMVNIKIISPKFTADLVLSNALNTGITNHLFIKLKTGQPMFIIFSKPKSYCFKILYWFGPKK